MIFVGGKWQYNLYYISMLLFALVMFWGRSLITISTILVFVSWIAGGNFSQKIHYLKQRKEIGLLLIYFLWYVIGLLYSQDTDAANRKIVAQALSPILLLVIGTMPSFSKSQLKHLLYAGLFSLIANSLFNLWHFYFYQTDQLDSRSISTFMSHIRLSMFVVLFICISIYYLFFSKEVMLKTEKMLLGISGLWLMFFILILKSLTGITILGFVLLLLIYINAYREKNKIVLSLLSLIIISGGTYLGYTLNKEIRSFTHPVDVPLSEVTKTSSGHYYNPFVLPDQIENGYYVYNYYCDLEIVRGWEKVSSIPFYGKDANGQPIRTTLTRYLTSKGLRKDFDGIKQLTPEDIKAIENGISNYRFTNNLSLSARIYQVVWEVHAYMNNHNPSGHSVTQRIEFLKCALSVIKENLWFGVGSGDMKEVMLKHYDKINSKLDQAHRLFPHNQYVSLILMFGIIGFGTIALSSIIAFYRIRKRLSFLLLTVCCILLISMFNEDTLDNQAGLLLMVYFGYTFFFATEEKYQIENSYSELNIK